MASRTPCAPQRGVRRRSAFQSRQLRLELLDRCAEIGKTLLFLLDDLRWGAGDLIAFAGGEKLVVVTAAHAFGSGTDDGGASDTYTRLWLGALEE